MKVGERINNAFVSCLEMLELAKRVFLIIHGNQLFSGSFEPLADFFFFIISSIGIFTRFLACIESALEVLNS
jgi:hypothetical protein